ncbi:MAG: SCP2 sterol-binding domain-containing protein [Candidatus Bathyarchaeia archaeon]
MDRRSGTNISVRQLFQAIAMRANRSVEGTKIMQNWTKHYHGKVIQFQTDTEKFHLVIVDGKMKVVEGEYAAPDLTFQGSSKTISEVFTGKKRIGDALKNWELVLIGAGHEGFTLGRLITTVLLEV